MMTKKVGRDQAESLREKFNDFEDITSYPPRSEVHKLKRSKRKLKVKYPLLRLLVITFIFLPLMVLSIMYYLEHKNKSYVSNPTEFEEVNVHYSENSNVEDEGEQPNDDVSNNDEENDQENEVNEGEQKQNNDEEIKKEESTYRESSENQDNSKTEENIQNAKQNEKKSPQYKVVSHIVQPGETLFRISMKYYKSRDGEKIIRDYNNLNENEIYEGQVLKIPLIHDGQEK